jgi:hypothetical protein
MKYSQRNVVDPSAKVHLRSSRLFTRRMETDGVCVPGVLTGRGGLVVKHKNPWKSCSHTRRVPGKPLDHREKWNQCSLLSDWIVPESTRRACRKLTEVLGRSGELRASVRSTEAPYGRLARFGLINGQRGNSNESKHAPPSWVWDQPLGSGQHSGLYQRPGDPYDRRCH